MVYFIKTLGQGTGTIIDRHVGSKQIKPRGSASKWFRISSSRLDILNKLRALAK